MATVYGLHQVTNTVAKYNINTNGTLWGTNTHPIGYINARRNTGLSINIAVVDAGLQQIVRFYNTTTGVQSTQLGVTGGYASTPTLPIQNFF